MVVEAQGYYNTIAGWWCFTNPSEKYAQVKLGSSSSPNRDKNKKSLRPPPSLLSYKSHLRCKLLLPMLCLFGASCSPKKKVIIWRCEGPSKVSISMAFSFLKMFKFTNCSTSFSQVTQIVHILQCQILHAWQSQRASPQLAHPPWIPTDSNPFVQSWDSMGWPRVICLEDEEAKRTKRFCDYLDVPGS